MGILLKCLEGYYSYFCRSFEAQFAILNRLHRAILAHFLSFKTALLQQLNFQITINALTITIKTVLHALVTPFFFLTDVFATPSSVSSSQFFRQMISLHMKFYNQNAFNYVVIASEIFRYLIFVNFVKQILDDCPSRIIQSLYHYLWHNFSLICNLMIL